MIQSSITISKKEEMRIDEIIQRMKDLQIKFEKFEEKGQSSRASTKQRLGSIEGVIHRCMWCNSMDHSRRKYEDFIEALHKGIIFFTDGMIYLKESEEKLELNFGNGGMKVLMVHAKEADL